MTDGKKKELRRKLLQAAEYARRARDIMEIAGHEMAGEAPTDEILDFYDAMHKAYSPAYDLPVLINKARLKLEKVTPEGGEKL